jgi:hypothetical protein
VHQKLRQPVALPELIRALGPDPDLRGAEGLGRFVVLVGQKKAVAIAVRNVSGPAALVEAEEWLSTDFRSVM